MATGGSVLADTEAAALAQTIPPEFRLGGWACQDMLSVDVAPGRGVRGDGTGDLCVPEDLAGLGFAPSVNMLGGVVARYEILGILRGVNGILILNTNYNFTKP